MTASSDALSLAAALPEQGVWQPADTAPKDGTQILIAVAGDEYEVAWAYWNERWRIWVLPMTNRAYQMEPTHWMPLPAPPLANSVSGGSSREAQSFEGVNQ